MKSLLKVSKVSEVDDIEQIVSTKEWRDFEKNLKEENFDKILPTCKRQCQVRDDELLNKIKNEGLDLF
jgi:NADH:ubiquinone oxidoreductase subunit C